MRPRPSPPARRPPPRSGRSARAARATRTPRPRARRPAAASPAMSHGAESFGGAGDARGERLDGHPAGLVRARHRVAARSSGVTWATSSRRSATSIRRPSLTKLADILGVEDDYPELQQKPSFAQVPNLVLTDALTPLEPEVDGDTKVFRAHHRGDRALADRRAGGTGQGPRLQRPVARTDDPRQPGRQGPRDLHEQPARDHQRPLPRRRVRRLLPGRRPVRDPEADRAGRGVRLRVHRGERGLAHVPLAPQRHRSGRSRSARRVHRRAIASRRHATTASTSGSRMTRSAGSRSTATASPPPCRSSPRRASACSSGS